MRKYKFFGITTMLALFSFTSLADTYWNGFSVSYLSGSDYQVGPSERKLVTLEYVSGESWGDQFFFIDRTLSPSDSISSYFEWSPRFKVVDFGKESFFQHLSIATTLESGPGFNNILLGVGTNLAVPGFNYLGLNLYRAKNDNNDDDYQLTLNWGYPFTIGNMEFLADGFIDYSSASASSSAALLVHPQIKWNLTQLLGMKKSKLYIGIEYDYWRNKFGIPGVNERNPNLLIKFHF